MLDISDIDRASEICHALASPLRLRVLGMLDEKPLNISELSQQLQVPLSSTATAVSVLEKAGLVISKSTPGVRGAQKLCALDRGIALWCMEAVHLMTKNQRSRMIADPLHVWPMAFAIRYRTLRGMEPLHVDISRLGRGRLKALTQALAVLRTLTK